MIKLVLLGGGGHCESVIDVIEQLSDYSVEGILDPSFTAEKSQEISGYPIIGNDNMIPSCIKDGFHFVITVGQVKSTGIRKKLYNIVKKNNGNLPVIIAKNAHVSKYSSLKEGTVVMQFAMVNSNSKVGLCCIINNYGNVEHGCEIGNFNHVSTGAILNGEVKTGNDVFIGSGSIINEGCNIGDRVIIGSGSVVRKQIPSDVLCYGNPLRIKKKS
ncbi:acetyltransferase [Flagellimonas sp. 2504JD1-5]